MCRQSRAVTQVQNLWRAASATEGYVSLRRRSKAGGFEEVVKQEAAESVSHWTTLSRQSLLDGTVWGLGSLGTAGDLREKPWMSGTVAVTCSPPPPRPVVLPVCAPGAACIDCGRETETRPPGAGPVLCSDHTGAHMGAPALLSHGPRPLAEVTSRAFQESASFYSFSFPPLGARC